MIYWRIYWRMMRRPPTDDDVMTFYILVAVVMAFIAFMAWSVIGQSIQ
jgi:hypothetical protein